ncbi:glycosyltransferase family 4 protein [Streptomyces sp. NBC_01142]|uniref:glycosyltransferase family 4 protein n=1 Tax=Streptomyces sp. NBC_01142 TaxID=2975865 RepID=UPI00225B08CE|nr:glycosyltransferase family 4 protein [Streptomyces sp. NBC_01142]MCX4823043.1 glycosyltransferase family 4 protein [Streptomyces sp. NBC_01142]
MKISFLIHTIYGIGGTIRTTLNLAEELANRHEVEIVSVFHHRDTSAFVIDPRITVVPLVDIRPDSPADDKQNPLFSQPSTAFPRAEARYKEYNRLVDDRVREHYATSDADIVIGTRPGLVAYVAQFAPSSAVRVGQEHMTHNHHKAALREEMYEHLDAIDAFVTVSEGDAAVWREKTPLPTTRVLAIPNSVPEPPIAPSDGTGKTIVAAGRLASEKQYHVLIDAFAKVVALRPDWMLRIYGSGDQRDKLRSRINELGLYNQIHLMGAHSPIEPEWAKGAIAASTSRHESFGMTVVEAMRCGVPMVSTDCDYGPREIIQDGVDGLLVPVGDVEAISQALLRLIDDEGLRRRMGAAAVRNARRFDPGVVTKQYEALFDELAADAAHRGNGRGIAPVADCVVDSDGSLTLTLVPPLPEGAERGARLVCTRTGKGGEVRAFDFNAGGSVTVPADEVFPEGLWNAFVELAASGARGRITARVVDQRGAMHAAERLAPGESVRNLLPYEDKAKGNALMLRAWSRPVHAEADDVQVDGTRITLSGSLFGPATVSGRPALLLRRRGKPSDELSFPGEQKGANGFSFTFSSTAPAAVQTSAHDVWDAFVRYAPDAKPVKIGRVLDDVVMKKDIYIYPQSVLPKRRTGSLARAAAKRALGRPRARVRARVYYTLSNDVALNVVDL